MPVVECQNPNCDKSFNVPNAWIKRGRGKYCSRECHSEARNIEVIKKKDKIIDLYINQGYSVPQISKELNIYENKISQLLHEEGIQLRRSGISPASMKNTIEGKYKDKIVKMYTIDLRTTAQIANIIGCKETQILRILKKNKIPRISNTLRSKIEREKYFSKIKHLYVDLELSLTEIEKKLEISRHVVKKSLMENKIKLRPKKWYYEGNRNYNWKGGIAYGQYCPKFNEEFKERVREFWGRKCPICGKTEKENKQKLSVHHVNFEKMSCCNIDIQPLFTAVCRSCHSKTNNNRKYWEEMLTNYIMIWFDGESYLPKI